MNLTLSSHGRYNEKVAFNITGGIPFDPNEGWPYYLASIQSIGLGGYGPCDSSGNATLEVSGMLFAPEPAESWGVNLFKHEYGEYILESTHTVQSPTRLSVFTGTPQLAPFEYVDTGGGTYSLTVKTTHPNLRYTPGVDYLAGNEMLEGYFAFKADVVIKLTDDFDNDYGTFTYTDVPIQTDYTNPGCTFTGLYSGSTYKVVAKYTPRYVLDAYNSYEFLPSATTEQTYTYTLPAAQIDGVANLSISFSEHEGAIRAQVLYTHVEPWGMRFNISITDGITTQAVTQVDAWGHVFDGLAFSANCTATVVATKDGYLDSAPVTLTATSPAATPRIPVSFYSVTAVPQNPSLYEGEVMNLSFIVDVNFDDFTHEVVTGYTVSPSLGSWDAGVYTAPGMVPDATTNVSLGIYYTSGGTTIGPSNQNVTVRSKAPTISDTSPNPAVVGASLVVTGTRFVASILYGGTGSFYLNGYGYLNDYVVNNSSQVTINLPSDITAETSDISFYDNHIGLTSNLYSLTFETTPPPGPTLEYIYLVFGTPPTIPAESTFDLNSYFSLVAHYSDSSELAINEGTETWSFEVGDTGLAIDASLNASDFTPSYNGVFKFQAIYEGLTSTNKGIINVAPFLDDSLGAITTRQGETITLYGSGFLVAQTHTFQGLELSPSVPYTVSANTNTSVSFIITENVVSTEYRDISIAGFNASSNIILGGIIQEPVVSPPQVPVITEPTAHNTTPGALLSVYASNIVELTTQAYLNNQNISTVYGDQTHVIISIPSDIGQTQTFDLTLSNDAGSSMSNVWSLTVNVPIILVALQPMQLAMEVAATSQTNLVTEQAIIAHYSDESTADVTASCSYTISFDPALYAQVPSSPYPQADPGNTGTVNGTIYTATTNGNIYNLVVASYTEGGITKTVPFGIGVSVPSLVELIYITALPSSFSCQPGASYDVKGNTTVRAYYNDQSSMVVTTGLSFSVFDRPEHGTIDENGIYSALPSGGPDLIEVSFFDSLPGHVAGKTAITYITAEVTIPVPPDTTPKITKPTETVMLKGIDFNIFGEHLSAVTYVAILDKNMNILKAIDTFVLKADNKIVIAGFDDLDLKDGYILATTSQF